MNCPKCKSIIKEGNVSCKVCGWSGVNPETVISWEYIHSHKDVKSVIIKDILISFLALTIINPGFYFIIFGTTNLLPKANDWLPVAFSLSFLFIVIIIGIFYEDRLYFQRHHYKYTLSESNISTSDQNNQKLYNWQQISHFRISKSWWREINKIFLFMDKKERNHVIIHLPKDKSETIRIITKFEQIQKKYFKTNL